MKYEKEFRSWASKAGIPEAAIETIIRHAPSNSDFESTAEDMTPKIYPLEGILAAQSREEVDIDALTDGFVIVGSCPNGDPIVVDLRMEPGSIWYLSHEEMFHAPLRSVCLKVAKSLKDFTRERDTLPIDYWAAKENT
jgi:hypothetical protein